MRSRIWLVLALGLATIAPAGFLLRAANSGEKSARTLPKVLRLSGQTSARHYANIVAPAAAASETRLLELTYLAKSGTAVKKGQTVAELDGAHWDGKSEAEPGEAETASQIKQAKSGIVRRQAEQAVEWETLQQSLRQAKAELEKAKAEMDRAKTDARQPGAGLTAIERELLRLNVEEAEARYAKLQETVRLERASFEAEIRILDLTRELEQRQHERHARDLRQYQVKAPMDGVVVLQSIARGGESEQVQTGDQIAPGQLFMKIVDAQTMQLEARANQAESGLLHIGQKVKVRLDAFPSVSLPGHIYSIGALAVGNGGQGYYIRSIAVNIAIDGNDPKLMPDLPASGDVLLE